MRLCNLSILFLILSFGIFACSPSSKVVDNIGVEIKISGELSENNINLIRTRFATYFKLSEMLVETNSSATHTIFNVPMIDSKETFQTLIRGKGYLIIKSEDGLQTIKTNKTGIDEIKRTVDNRTGNEVIEFQFNDENSDLFFTLTSSAVKENVKIYVDDLLIMNPMIMAPIEKGRLVVDPIELKNVDLIYALVNHPADELSGIIIETRYYLPDNKSFKYLTEEDNENYKLNQEKIKSNKARISSLISAAPEQDRQMAAAVVQNIDRLISSDIGGYLKGTKITYQQFQELMDKMNSVNAQLQANQSFEKALQDLQIITKDF